MFKKESIPIYGNGLQLRDWLHVEDNCNALFKVINNGKIGGKYCIGVHGEKTNLEGKPDGTKKNLDISRVKSLGWEPKITLEQGIVNTLEPYEKQYKVIIKWNFNIWLEI